MPPTAPDAPDPPGPWGRRVLVAVVVGATLYLGLALLADAGALGAVLQRLRAPHLLLALAFVVASLLVRSVRWRLYLRRLGVPTSPLQGVLLGVPQGRTGLVVKAQHLRERGVRYGRGIPAVVAERTVEILAVAALLLLSLPWAPRGAWLPAALAAALALAYALLLRTPRILEPLLRRLEAWGIARHRAHDLRLALHELPPLLGGRLLAGALVISMAGMALEAGALWSLARGMGLDLGVGVCVFAYFAGAMAGIVSALPAGMLATEGGMIGALLGLGLGLPEAAALTLATRACTLWFSLALGIGAAVVVSESPPASDPRT